MKSFNLKMAAFAVSAAIVSGSAHAKNIADEFDMSQLVGPGSTFIFGQPAQKNPNDRKSLEKEVKVSADEWPWLYFEDGQQVPQAQYNKNYCRVLVHNATGSPQIINKIALTVSTRVYQPDPNSKATEAFAMDLSKQTGPISVVKVECTAPVEKGRYALLGPDMVKAFGNFATTQYFPSAGYNPNQSAPQNPASPIANTGGPGSGKQDPTNPACDPSAGCIPLGSSTAAAPASGPAQAGSGN